MPRGGPSQDLTGREGLSRLRRYRPRRLGVAPQAVASVPLHVTDSDMQALAATESERQPVST